MAGPVSLAGAGAGQHMVMVASAAKPRPGQGDVAHSTQGTLTHKRWLSHSDGVGGIIVPITKPFLLLVTVLVTVLR